MATINESILFTVGTMGTSTAAKSMAKVVTQIGLAVGAVTLLGKKFFELSEQSALFMRTVKEVNIPMQRFNEQTKGLIDTTRTYQAAAKLQTANVRLTGREFAALGAAATKAAQAAGEGPEGATTRFERLTKAIISGRETALKEYGIEVSQTTDLIKFQSEAIEKITADYKDWEAQLQTTGEKMASLQNTLGTVVDFEMDSFKKAWSSLTVEMMGGHEVLSQWESDLVATKGEMNNFFSILTTGEEIQLAHNDAMWEGVDVARVALEGSGKLIRSEEEKAAAYRLVYNELRQVVVLEETRAKIAMLAAKGTQSAASAIAAAAASGLAGTAKTAKSSIKRSSVGGVGRGGDLLDSFTIRQTGDPLDTGIDPLDFSTIDPQGSKEGDAAFARGQSASAQMNDLFAKTAMEKEMERKLLERENQRSHLEIMLGLEQDHIDAKNQLYAADAEARVNANAKAVDYITQSMMNLGNLQEANSKEGLAMQKAILIPATLAQGTMAAVSGFRSVMDSGIPFPFSAIVGGIFAASIEAMAIKSAIDIGRLQYGQKSKSGGAGKVSAPRAAGLSTGSMGRSGGGGGNTYNFEFKLAGQTMLNGIINENETAMQSGNRSFLIEG